jgi:hypothetical protein
MAKVGAFGKKLLNCLQQMSLMNTPISDKYICATQKLHIYLQPEGCAINNQE